MVPSMTYIIVKSKTIDDGTTTGKQAYQTADGSWWVESNYTPQTTPTAVKLGRKDGDTIKMY